MLVYSATSLDSFHKCLDIFRQLCKTRRGSVSSREEVNWFPVALVENKIDLVEERQVAEGAGEQAARAIGALFVRTCAKRKRDVDTAFKGAIKFFLGLQEGVIVPPSEIMTDKNKRCIVS